MFSNGWSFFTWHFIWGVYCTLGLLYSSFRTEQMYLWDCHNDCQLSIITLNVKWLLELASWQLSLRWPDTYVFLFPAEREDNVNAYSLKFTDEDSEGSNSWPVQARQLIQNQSLSVRIRPYWYLEQVLFDCFLRKISFKNGWEMWFIVITSRLIF